MNILKAIHNKTPTHKDRRGNLSKLGMKGLLLQSRKGTYRKPTTIPSLKAEIELLL